MALSIPINFMNSSGPQPPSPSNSTDAPNTGNAQPATVPPTKKTTGSHAAAQDGNTGGEASREQQAAAYSRQAAKTSSAPTKADTQSVVTAQVASPQGDGGLITARRSVEENQQVARTQALIDSVSATSSAPSTLFERTEPLDRYAPPDPLPTAPILKGEAPTPVKTTPN